MAAKPQNMKSSLDRWRVNNIAVLGGVALLLCSEISQSSFDYLGGVVKYDA